MPESSLSSYLDSIRILRIYIQVGSAKFYGDYAIMQFVRDFSCSLDDGGLNSLFAFFLGRGVNFLICLLDNRLLRLRLFVTQIRRSRYPVSLTIFPSELPVQASRHGILLVCDL